MIMTLKKYPNDSITEFYECAEEIASVLDKYFGRACGPVEDMEHINTFVEEYTNGWGIDARCCGSLGQTEREGQQEKIDGLTSVNSFFTALSGVEK